ncbi:MAG TPA: chemotaxis protein CheB, partial [Gammaproteobacteria bacterium]
MRIAIVHDNTDAIRLFSQLIDELGHELIWSTRSGINAILQCHKNLPDLVLIKLDLPDMGGVEITRSIMNQTPTTVIVICKSIKTYPAKVFEAMSAGALDAFAEPEDNQPETLQNLKNKIQNINKLHKSISRKHAPEKNQIEKDIPLIAIGASTGGPAALVKVLTRLPESIDAVIVIIQHMDNQFSEGLVKWL